MQGIPKVLEMSYQKFLFLPLTIIFHLSGNFAGNFCTNNVNPVSKFSEFLVKIEGALRFKLPPCMAQNKRAPQQSSYNLLSLLTAAILLFKYLVEQLL